MLVKMLIDGVSKDGNLLLNVGPTARGEFDDQALHVLGEIGKWMRRHKGSVYGCGPARFTPPPDCRYTAGHGRVYLHIFSWPFGHLHLNGLAGRVEFARFLHDGSEVRREEIDPQQTPNTVRMAGPPGGTLTLKLPVRRPDTLVPVFELFMR